MAQLLDEIEWGECLLPARPDAAWEAEIRRRGAQVSEVDRRIAPSRWMREAGVDMAGYHPTALTKRLFQIGVMVTSQENACRYCYGANRAYLKILGYSEDFIRRIERDAHLAELDDKERAFIGFCRSLARSRPRPARAACEQLLAIGYSRREVQEMALVIAIGCCYNRISTLMACPPEQGFERMANGPLGRVIGLIARLTRPFRRDTPTSGQAASADAYKLAEGPFGAVLAPLAGLPGARIMKDALEGAFASDVLDVRTKALIFAVIARTLDCNLCVTRATDLLRVQGMEPQQITSALANLQAPQLPSGQARLLPWARGTVHYDPGKIQQETRALTTDLSEDELLEAIGVASLANATVRLAMLHE